MNEAQKGELVAAINVLVKRRASTIDAAEKTAINEAIVLLSGAIQDLDQAALLEAAQVVAMASDALETVVASARLGPFDTYLADIQRVMQRLQGQQAAVHAADALPPAPVLASVPAPTSTPTPTPKPEPASPSAPAPALPPETARPATPMLAEPLAGAAATAGTARRPVDSTVFDDLRDEYQADFERCALRPEFAGNIDFYVARLLKFRPVYDGVGAPLGVPWFFIGILHGMECGFDFGTHLHNGDPLTRRTVNVPRRRPSAGQPPFTWRDSALDALVFKGYDRETDWSPPRMLFLFEKYNGFGYRPLGVPSPYLWSFSTLYRAGKFVADRRFDPDAVSRQCGTAVMLKALQQGGQVG